MNADKQDGELQLGPQEGDAALLDAVENCWSALERGEPLDSVSWADIHVSPDDLDCLPVVKALHEAARLIAEDSQDPGVTTNSPLLYATDSPGKRARDDDTVELIAMLEPAVAPDELGRLGDFRVLKPLGKGGMGVVFLAEDTQLRRRVALKLLRPYRLRHRDAVERFIREARSAAAVRHDHVVTIYQVGQASGIPFIAQELLEGETLDDRLKRDGRLPLADALRIAREVTAGLAAAHKRGLLHRDVKPSNIWLENRECEGTCQVSSSQNRPMQPGEPQLASNLPIRVKILDFGLARGQEGDEQLTQTGTVLGTLAYMSPEQAQGHSVDAQSDLFSLGVVLFRMVTGQAPFHGTDPFSLLRALAVEMPPSAQSLNADVPSELSSLIAGLLKKERQHRPTSADEVEARLATIESTLNSRPAPAEDQGEKGRAPMACDPLMDPDESTSIHHGTKFASRATVTRPSRKQHSRLLVALSAAVVLMLCGIVITITHRDGSTTRVEITSSPPTGNSAVVRQSASLTDPPPLAIAPFDSGQAKAHQEAWARHLGVLVAQTNSIGMRLRLIPPGRFQMGSTEEEMKLALAEAAAAKLSQHYLDHIRNEAPQRLVTISCPYLVGETEVTIGQFRKFVESVQYVTETEKLGGGRNKIGAPYNSKILWNSPGSPVTDDSPVAQVTWIDCVAFCNWLSDQERLQPCYRHDAKDGWTLAADANGYRLPTAAEWEYACRAGTTTKYPFGDDIRQLEQYAWYNQNSGGVARAVGLKLPNHFGLHDMIGNQWEFCHDWFDPSWNAEKSLVDPMGPLSGTNRIGRGGSWNANAFQSRSAYGGSTVPTGRFAAVGFRIARPLATHGAKLRAKP